MRAGISSREMTDSGSGKATLPMDKKCCCDLIITLALDDVGAKDDKVIANLAKCFAELQDENRARGAEGREALVRAACVGRPCIKDGTFCGALAAAVAILYLAKECEDAADCQDELMDWFCHRFGGYECEAIESSLNIPKEELCPKVILATYLRLRGYIDPDNHLSQKTLI